MPRSSKEKNIDELSKTTKVENSEPKKKSSSKSVLNKNIEKNSKSASKKISSKTDTKQSGVKKEATVKKETLSTKKTTTTTSESETITRKKSTAKSDSKATTKKKTTAKSDSKATAKKKSSDESVSDKSLVKSSKVKKSSTTTKRSNSRNTLSKKIHVLEYYDLPYRYNQTVVKILAQTPNTLFVYWDISDLDRQNLINTYGEKFFEETKPVLIIHNESKNYSFEIEINDFANSWYLQIPDSKSSYTIELGRKKLQNTISNTLKNNITGYIYVTSSNKLEVPNDHILIEETNNSVYFKNVKTNQKEKIEYKTFIKNIEQIYNIYDIYIKIYPNEDVKSFKFDTPSSIELTKNIQIK